jgi:two-component system nitrogen regulation response regulator NtrX
VALLAIGRREVPSQSEGVIMGAETFADFKDKSERIFLLHKLRELDWNVSEVARVLDMPRSNLYKKMEKLGLRRDE